MRISRKTKEFTMGIAVAIAGVILTVIGLVGNF